MPQTSDVSVVKQPGAVKNFKVWDPESMEKAMISQEMERI